MKGDGNFIVGIGHHVQGVTKPAFDLFPELAGALIHPDGFVLAPIGIGIGRLTGGRGGLTGAVAFNGLAIG